RLRPNFSLREKLSLSPMLNVIFIFEKREKEKPSSMKTFIKYLTSSYNMLNQNNFKSPICTKWKELSKLDFNYYNSITNKKSEINFEQFSDEILQYLKNKNVVVNGGHFIPNSDDYEDIGRNPIKTWTLACKLVKHLQGN
ncbi:MAG: hypothetical protein ACOC1P_06460, partial [Minisyncoccales bacterium]